MKKIYIILLSLTTLLFYSCGTKDVVFIPDLPPADVSNIQPTYSLISYRDELSIKPVVKDEGDYEYLWTLYSINRNVNEAAVPKGEVLATTKDLTYKIMNTPGSYILTFNVKNKRTGVTKIIRSEVTISTLNMNGWYFLKDNGVTTDFDFIHKEGRIDNWIANYNNGRSLQGKAVKAVFATNFKNTLAGSDFFTVFMAASEQDAMILRVDNGKIVKDFDNMFFTKPSIRKVQNVLQPTATNFLNLINNGKLYTMVKGALFADPPVSNYVFSPVAAVGAVILGFDNVTKTAIGFDNSNFTNPNSAATALKNMNAEPIWYGLYPGLRGAGLALFRRADKDGFLVKLNATYGPLAGLSNSVVSSKTVPAAHSLMSADVIGGNYDADYIYYAKGNLIYMTDYASLPESLQVTLPPGEVVTCIQHVKYPLPATGVVSTVDFLAIATYTAGNYKVYLHPISSTGTIQPLTKANYEGAGRISTIQYLEQGAGSRVF
jgi:hypothetical protein